MVWASSTASPSTVADRSICTKSSFAAGALHPGEGGEPGAQVLQRLVDVGFGDRHVVDLHRERRQLRQRDLGAHVDLGGERQPLVVGDLGDLDLRLPQRRHVLGRGDGLGVLRGDGVVDDLLQHRAAAEAGLDDAGGHLALAEAGHVDLLGDLLVRAVEIGLQLVEGHLDVDPDPGRAEPLDGALHFWYSSIGSHAGQPHPGARPPRRRPSLGETARAAPGPTATSASAGPPPHRRRSRPRATGPSTATTAAPSSSASRGSGTPSARPPRSRRDRCPRAAAAPRRAPPGR